jgi:hypothetical protein
MTESFQTPVFEGEYDLSAEGGKIAFWKQILPKKQIHYTAKDGSRRLLNFDEKYLHDLATSKAVDKIGFLLADVDNRHTMDPERWRGEVAELAVRDDGLYGKIVFPNKEAAKAVLDNPDLGVSARIREGVPKSDGSVIPRGIVHVLGTLDPQVTGMSGWQTADLSSTEGDLFDLTSETYEDGVMGTKKSVADYTEAEIEAMNEDELNEFLAAAVEEFDEGILGLNDDDTDDTDDDGDPAKEKEPEMALSNEVTEQIDLANASAREALRQLAETRWETERENYLNAGVPPAALDLAAPVLNRPDEFVVDLSVTDGVDAEVGVGKIVRGLLDSLKGTVDLSVENGHSGTFKAGDGEDPDAEGLALWDKQF